MMSWIPYAIIVTLASAQVTTIQYLSAVRRLNDDSFMDHYFICETIGLQLTWEINERRVLFRSSSGNGTIMLEILPEYQYISILLLNQPDAGASNLVSLLVLSTNSTQSSNISVDCFSNHDIQNIALTTADNPLTQSPIVDSNSGNGLHLQYLFESTTINNPVVRYYYICGVESTTLLTWVLGSKSLSFDRNIYNIGTIERSLHMQDFTIVIGTKPFPLVALLIRETPDIDVSCVDTFDRNETISYIQLEPTIAQSTPTTSSGFTLFDTTTNFTAGSGPGEQPRQPVKLLWLIPTLAVGIIFAIVAIIVMIGIIVFYSRHNLPFGFCQSKNDIHITDKVQLNQSQDPAEAGDVFKVVTLAGLYITLTLS